jgi:outer membrane protein
MVAGRSKTTMKNDNEKCIPRTRLVAEHCTHGHRAKARPHRSPAIDALVLPGRKAAETKMQDFAKTLDDRLKAMGAEYQQKVADAQAGAADMTQTEKDIVVEEIQSLEQRIQAAQEKAQEDLAKQEEELLRPMVTETNAAIKKVAEANNFVYIFDVSTGFVLYFDKGEDILPLVKAELKIP